VLVARVQISWWPDFDTTRMVPFSARSLMAARARLPLICKQDMYVAHHRQALYTPCHCKIERLAILKSLAQGQLQSQTHPEPIGED
jgi:hypothetical protein